MWTLSAADGGLIVLGAALLIGGAFFLRRYLTRSTPISPVHAGKKDTCDGKFDRQLVRAREAKRLAAAPKIDTSNLPAPDARVVAVLSTVNVADLTRDLNELSGEVDTTVAGQQVRIASRNSFNPLLDTAMSRLEQEYAKLGIPYRRIKYTVRGRTMYNLEATITGTRHPDKVIIIGSHLDSTAGATSRSEKLAPGADDDGSGSIAVKTIAAALVALRKAGLDIGCTVRFLHFTGEEQGLWGSYTYSDAVAAAKEDIVAVYQMDMVAYCAKPGNRVDIHDDANRNGSHSLVVNLVRNVVRYALNLNPVDTHDHAVRDRSDQAGFLDHGYRAVLISEEFSDTGFNPNYHSVNDRVKNCNIPYMAEIIKMVIATVADDVQQV